MPKGHPLDLVGQHIGSFVVLEKVSRGRGKNVLWKVRCKCSNEKYLEYGHIKSGSTKSCGCQQRTLQSLAKVKHGKTFSREYRVWLGMKNRCKDHDNPDFGRYGARGIRVCERWMDFRNFYEDMGDCPPEMTLDRKDNNLGYSKENCRWATGSEQSRNRRSNRILTFRRESLPMIAWSERYRLPRYLLGARLKRGWSLEEALLTPVGGQAPRQCQLSFFDHDDLGRDYHRDTNGSVKVP